MRTPTPTPTPVARARLLLAPLLLAPLLLAACTGDGGTSRGGRFTERVQDGVTIAENPGLHLADSLAWAIDTTDVVRIGLLEGPDEYVIGRVAGLLRRPDGTILIADGLASELRLFDQEGRFLRRIGGRGEGPGEYTNIANLLDLPGDSVAVVSGFQVTVLDPDLAFARRFQTRLQETAATPPFSSDRLIDLFADGTPLMSDYLNVCGMARSDGFCQDSVAFLRTDEAGETEGRFGRFVYGRTEAYPVRAGFSTSWREPHPQPVWTAAGERFYFADAKRFEVRVHRSDGTLERVMRVAGAAPSYPRDEVFLPPQQSASDPPEAQEAIRVLEQARANAALPDSFPHFSDLLVDAEGNVWVREYLPPGRLSQETPRWFVFDPDGRLRWSLRSPPGMLRSFRPTVDVKARIGADFVLGTERSELGVETVVLYPLRKR